MRHRRRSGIGVSRLFPSGLPPQRRVSSQLGKIWTERQHWRLARRRRLRPLHGQLRRGHGDAAVGMGDLRSPAKSIQLKIPETGNGTPDILNEVRWNLEWMLKMQDTDGGAWHKQTSTHFPDFIAPEKDALPSEVIGTGSAPYKST